MTARSPSRVGGCSASSGRTAPGRRRRCARSSGSSGSTPVRSSGMDSRSSFRTNSDSATCRRSEGSTRECRSASSSPTSAVCTGWMMSAARDATARWLERLGLEDRASAKVEELSHGNQQRAQLAAASLHEPELLVLDEPFAGTRPDRSKDARRGSSRRSGPRRRRSLLQPSARARRGHLRGGSDHRPRPHRRHRRFGLAQTCLAATRYRARARRRAPRGGCLTSPASSSWSAATVTCGCWSGGRSIRNRYSQKLSVQRRSSGSTTARRLWPSSLSSW